jgi:hypothetical protein
MTVPKTLAVVLNPASGLEKAESRWYHAMTNALYVNALAMMKLSKKNASPPQLSTLNVTGFHFFTVRFSLSKVTPILMTSLPESLYFSA